MLSCSTRADTVGGKRQTPADFWLLLQLLFLPDRLCQHHLMKEKKPKITKTLRLKPYRVSLDEFSDSVRVLAHLQGRAACRSLQRC